MTKQTCHIPAGLRCPADLRCPSCGGHGWYSIGCGINRVCPRCEACGGTGLRKPQVKEAE
jgi:hypothetical protein